MADIGSEGEPTLRVAGWCNGDMETWGETTTLRRASSLGQMPHGRWRILGEEGRSTGITESETVPWTARVVDYDDGPQLGFTTFRLTDRVYEGTGEELALGLTKMLAGAHTTHRQSETGMVSHLVISNRRTDTRSVLAAVGLDVTNTNPKACLQRTRALLGQSREERVWSPSFTPLCTERTWGLAPASRSQRRRLALPSVEPNRRAYCILPCRPTLAVFQPCHQRTPALLWHSREERP